MFFTEKMLGRLRSKENYHDADEKEENLQQFIVVAIQGIFRNLKNSCKMEKRIDKERLKKKKKELHRLVGLTTKRLRHKMSYNYYKKKKPQEKILVIL